jgi:oxygen-independent coproporphyrinogen-3 oxidase
VTTLVDRIDARAGRWLEEPGFGVYVHVPFCRHRCHYCDFNTYEGLESLQRDYVDALIRSIERWPGAPRAATSVFFGGGTPTLLPTDQLRRVLGAVRDLTGFAKDVEITIEANPETVDQATFAALLDAGFGRFSIGVQSLAGRVLHGLGRTHGPHVALEALTAARRAGVEDLNADLIFGSPWESAKDWRTTLEGIAEAAPDHVSTYALTVEEGTPLATLVATGRVPDVDPDVQAARYEVADAVLSAAGYERYEISNWAQPGRASRHNVLYWSAGDYLGFGAGAHGHLAGRRWWSLRLPREFVAAVASGRSTEDGSEVLAGDQRASEALVLGLRLSDGIDLDGFARRFGRHPLAGRGEAVARLEQDGLLRREGGRLLFAPGAALVANEVLCRLL